MSARLLLHLCALVLPTLAMLAFLFAMDGRIEEGAWQAVLPAVLAAEMAAGAGWYWLDADLRRGARRPLRIGFATGLLTHALLGPCMVLLELLTPASVFGGSTVKAALVVSGISLVMVGWISVPAVMAVMAWIARIRLRERALLPPPPPQA